MRFLHSSWFVFVYLGVLPFRFHPVPGVFVGVTLLVEERDGGEEGADPEPSSRSIAPPVRLTLHVPLPSQLFPVAAVAAFAPLLLQYYPTCCLMFLW